MLGRHLTQRRDLPPQMLGTRTFALQLARVIGGFHNLIRRRRGTAVRDTGLPAGTAFYPLLHGILPCLRHPVLMPAPVPGTFRAAATARVPKATLDSHLLQCMKFWQTLPNVAWASST